MKASPLVACALALGCLVTGAAVARTAAKAVTTATIVNSGSTNSAPFKVTVDAGGRVQTGRGAAVTIAAPVAKQFFSDLRAAQAHPSPSGAAMCFKSASFGSVMRVQAGTWSSVDLNCPVAGANAALKADVNTILGTVHPEAGPRPITLPSNEPRSFPVETQTPAPAATP
jgi:hypothetical protein